MVHTACAASPHSRYLWRSGTPTFGSLHNSLLAQMDVTMMLLGWRSYGYELVMVSVIVGSSLVMMGGFPFRCGYDEWFTFFPFRWGYLYLGQKILRAIMKFLEGKAILLL